MTQAPTSIQNPTEPATLAQSPLLVIGHKNPDTDAICSALAYADFLRLTRYPEARAACCGEINARTAYALSQAGIEQPELVVDVRPTVESVMSRQTVIAHANESLFEAFNRLRASGHHSLPVVTEDNKFLGLVAMTKLVEALLPSSASVDMARVVETTLNLIVKVLGGKVVNDHRLDEECPFILTVGASSAQTFRERLNLYPPENLLVVAGDRPTVQLPAIDYGVRAIVVTGGSEMRDDVIELAKERGIAVLYSPHDTAATTMLIKCAKRISLAVESKLKAFPPQATLRSLHAIVAGSNQPLFPVLDENEQLVGVFSKSDLLRPPRKRLVLVDHNEMAQAVDGASEADIIEVIDHHRLGGGLTSQEPIRFLNDPLGSTCTIVARLFREHGLEPSRGISICLLAGLVSDTLLLTSPTTTQVDREMCEWLSQLHDIEVKAFTEELFAAGSSLQTNTPEKIVRGDCKKYSENEWEFAIAQVEELGFDYFWPRLDALRTALIGLIAEKKLDFACLLITDITTHDSYLLCEGKKRLFDDFEYPETKPDLFHLANVVSRKKQLLPALIRLTAKVPRGVDE